MINVESVASATVFRRITFTSQRAARGNELATIGNEIAAIFVLGQLEGQQNSIGKSVQHCWAFSRPAYLKPSQALVQSATVIAAARPGTFLLVVRVRGF